MNANPRLRFHFRIFTSARPCNSVVKEFLSVNAAVLIIDRRRLFSERPCHRQSSWSGSATEVIVKLEVFSFKQAASEINPKFKLSSWAEAQKSLNACRRN
ncbi:uncharacterized protein ARMOST_10705 [Armillaria ostoyae]|uniref:Uncharacterized protein n=1 Tax=Armillaria ostoyae TaxID=47428 RepID=A0A284RF68_ARMOS|nr:uncharacterized protein ARMOST_10705 [Armillaria ostoyae]